MTGALTTLFDTSAFVGVLSKTDQYHAASTSCLQSLTGRFVTTLPVITEAHYLLRGVQGGREKLLELFTSGAVEVVGLGNGFFEKTSQLARRYADRDVQLADASLIWLAEILQTERVFTFDTTDFNIYRIDRGHQGVPFEILPSAQ